MNEKTQFTKDDLLRIATTSECKDTRVYAAEALYIMGQRDGIAELQQLRRAYPMAQVEIV